MSVAPSTILLRYLADRDQIMNQAYVESLQLLATPFPRDTPQPFVFGPGSTWADITAETGYPDYATASSHAATMGNVLAQQVRLLNLFRKQV